MGEAVALYEEIQEEIRRSGCCSWTVASGGVAGGSCRGGLIAQAGGRTLTVWIGICALGRGHINFFVRVVLASAFFPMPSI